METMGAIPEGEFYSFNEICSDEADFMAKLFNNCSSTHWPSHESIMNISGADESSIYSSDETNTSLYSFPQENDYNGGNSMLFPSSSEENYYPNNFMTMNYCMTESNNNDFEFHAITDNVTEGEEFLNQDVFSNDSVQSNENLPEDVLQGKRDKVGSQLELSKKRPQIYGEVHRSKKSMKLKKCLKVHENDEANNNNNVMLHRQRSSSCCSEDDSNASNETGTLNLIRKKRASKGSATDPQSLYARKRRERINERLRILQNLVPNGTKVDISTMLEEAVLYVKFLQLQIKLLSSDEHWMYSPIAYNGMDIGLLELQIPTPKSQT